jgi:hypothetical protein
MMVGRTGKARRMAVFSVAVRGWRRSSWVVPLQRKMRVAEGQDSGSKEGEGADLCIPVQIMKRGKSDSGLQPEGSREQDGGEGLSHVLFMSVCEQETLIPSPPSLH